MAVAIGRSDSAMLSNSLSLSMHCQATHICELRWGSQQLISDAEAVPTISVIDEPQDRMRWKRVEMAVGSRWISLQVGACCQVRGGRLRCREAMLCYSMLCFFGALL